MAETIDWSTNSGNVATPARRFLSHVSLSVREDQFRFFWEKLSPKRGGKILDIGMTPDEKLVDSNFFEKRYPYPQDLTAVSVEDCSSLQSKYFPIKIKKIFPFKPLPFPSKSFDIVVSWATLEHVGTREQQSFFLAEAARVGKKFFVTTPNKDFFYEPHSGIFFLHWLPSKYFKKICSLLRKDFWGDIRNLNPLSKIDIQNIRPKKINLSVINYQPMKLFTTHLIIIKK